MSSAQPQTENGASILDRVSAFLSRFVVLSRPQVVELSLWIAHTHAFEAAIATPYQNIHSAEKESGKTRLLEVLELLVAEPWMTGRVSAAALVREIDSAHPTLLLDEGDAAFGRDKEYAEALREVLNMGHRRGGKATICIGQGTSIKTKRFEVFCPKAIAGIGRLPDTVAGRSVPIRLKRKAHSEIVERFRPRLAEPQANELRQLVAAWTRESFEQLKNARPSFPEGLRDRQEDGAEPLLAIADLAGGHWPQRAREALVELFTGTAAQDDSIRTRLLADVRTAFELRCSEKLSTAEMIGALADMETAPWAEFNQGKPLTPSTLARLLKPFDITPRDIRIGDRILKGYERNSFEDGWERYLPPRASASLSEGQQGQQTAICSPVSEIGKGQPSAPVAGLESKESPASMRAVADVAPSWDEIGALSTRKIETKPNGTSHCRIHPTNKAQWWLRGGVDLVCAICHPDPTTL
jgi:Protein of unknown function (DUF3631)